MKCPKCHYLSFDPEPRCRNCGYTLALGEDVDLAIKPTSAPEAPPLDLTLRLTDDPLPLEASAAADADIDRPRQARTSPPRRRRRAAAARGPFDGEEAPLTSSDDEDDRLESPTAVNDLDIPLESNPSPAPSAVPSDAPLPASEPPVVPRITRPAPSVAPVTAELPLFVKAMPIGQADDAAALTEADAPMVPLISEPQPPLAVRRAPDTGTRMRAAETARKLGPLDRDLLEDLERIETNERLEADAEARAARRGERAGTGLRLGAAVVDTVLLAGLASGIVWTTLRWCDLSMQQVRVLPAVPTAGFLVLIGFGYLLIFTAAGGQTLGKMLFRVRVVSDQPGEESGAMSLGQAVYREVLALPSILAFGLGFLPGLFGDRRALHDRLAHTQVVRA